MYRKIDNFGRITIPKEMRNKINRLNNFENANFDKTLDASLTQLALNTILSRHFKLGRFIAMMSFNLLNDLSIALFIKRSPL
mgnify:CR=1 FL=1